MKPLSVLLKSALAISLVSFTIPAFAQHGGGGHGGGGGSHGGGGGFHGGGGMHSSAGPASRGGGFYAPPAAGYAGSRSAAPHYGNSYASRPGNSYSRPGGNFANGNGRAGNSASGSGAAADGQWHSFGGARGTSGAQSQAGPSSNSDGFHVSSGNRGAASNGAVRSFSGQGGEVWENSPAATNMVSRSQSLSTLHNSFVGSRAAAAGLRPNATLSASSRFTGGSALANSRGLVGGFGASNSVQPLRGSNRIGIPFGGNRGGCWSCGYGFGGWGRGWGLGWPYAGFWGFGWDPFIYDPWWGGDAWPGYGYYGGPDNYIYPDPGNYGPDYNSAPPDQQQQNNDYDEDYQGSSNGNWVTPNEPRSSSAQRSPDVAVPVLIYLKSGKILTVRDYWMVDDELHYLTMGGTQNIVDLEQVDLPRTNTENAKSGVKFIFKSEPSAAPPTPDPAPTQELNAVPHPEAET